MPMLGGAAMPRPSRRALARALVPAAFLSRALAGARPAAAQQRSGMTVLTFFEHLNAGEMDAAMFNVLPEVEVTLPDGTAVVGRAAARAVLTDYPPRPIVVIEHRHLRRMAYEAYVTAAGAPLYVRFRGAIGITAIAFSPDPRAPA
jgi:hypothetical protein